MPYVEVWVDDVDCRGGCDEAQKLKRRRDFAFSLLLERKVNAAMDALTQGVIPDDFKVGSDLQGRYKAWSQGELAGFEGPAIAKHREPDHAG